MFPETIFTRLAAQAARAEEASALYAFGQRPLSFGHLLKQIERVVAAMHSSGIGRNDRLAVVLPHGPETAVACLAVASGATCVPLNPEYTAAEFEQFLPMLGVRGVLVRHRVKSPVRMVARTLGLPVLEISGAETPDDAWFGIRADETTATRPRRSEYAQADDIALVLHTSGTSARPKIVPLTHRNVCASAANVARSLALSSADRALNMMPLFHVGGLVDLLVAPLAVGGSVVCTASISIPDFLRSLQTFAPTWFQGVPTMLQEIAMTLDGEPAVADVRSLRLIRAASAALPGALREHCERVFQCPVVEIYGMTEAAGLITSDPLDQALRRAGSVGLPAGPEVAVVNDGGESVAPGELGEVVIRGTSVMSGYEGLEDADAYRVGDEWLRTGDQGRLDEDGYLFLTGRLKEIINRAGEKVSPGEVDGVLLSHPSIAAAATFAIPHGSLGEDVAVAVVRRKGCRLTGPEVIAFARKRLAYFKVPHVVHFVDELPTGPGGKVRRAALSRQLGSTVPAEERDASMPVAASTPTTAALAALWAEVLGREAVGIHDNFFDLGGDSLKAAAFANTVQERWGETLYVSAVFDAPTIAEFERFLRREYPELVAKLLGQELTPEQLPVKSRVCGEMLAEFRRAIAPVSPLGTPPNRKQAPVIFILSPPRSGSTLLRVMLGGHSRLFAPPELYLLSFADLAERKAWRVGAQQSLLEGNIRGLMELRGVGAEQAQALMADLEQEETPIHRYYGLLQQWLGDRILVDKTPWNAVHSVALERAEACCDGALYIHLRRHPYGMIRSFEEARLEQLWYPRLVDPTAAGSLECPYTSRELAEMVWMVVHENIHRFLTDIPTRRQLHLGFEALVREPERSMQTVCQFVGVDCEPELLKPQERRRDRMTDGIHPSSRMIGDMKFHRHDRIDADTADLWKRSYAVDFLSDEAWRMAHAMGYSETIADVAGREEFAF